MDCRIAVWIAVCQIRDLSFRVHSLMYQLLSQVLWMQAFNDLSQYPIRYALSYTRDLSSAGRASALQAEGHRFEPYRSHSSIIYWWCVCRCGGIGRRKGLKIPHVYPTRYRANPWFYWISRKSKNIKLFIHRKYPSKYQGKPLRLMYIHTMLVWRNRQTQGT